MNLGSLLDTESTFDRYGPSNSSNCQPVRSLPDHYEGSSVDVAGIGTVNTGISESRTIFSVTLPRR